MKDVEPEALNRDEAYIVRNHPIMSSMVPENQDYQTQAAEILHVEVTKMTSEAEAGWVTAMIVDMPLDAVIEVLTNRKVLQTRVDIAL